MKVDTISCATVVLKAKLSNPLRTFGNIYSANKGKRQREREGMMRMKMSKEGTYAVPQLIKGGKVKTSRVHGTAYYCFLN